MFDGQFLAELRVVVCRLQDDNFSFRMQAYASKSN